MGGYGHMSDMNNRMKQNRSMKTSNKEKFKLSSSDHHDSNNDSKKIHFKKVSKDEMIKIKEEIKHNTARDRKRERLVIGITVIVFILVVWLLQ